MVGPGALKPKVGDGIKSRRPFSAPVLHSFILLFFFFVLCLLLHLYCIIIIIIIIIYTTLVYVHVHSCCLNSAEGFAL